MSFKPTIGVFLSNEKELNNLLDRYPYYDDKILSDRKEFIGRSIDYEHYSLHIFYGICQNARGYKFSNIIVSETVMNSININNKDDYEGLLCIAINPFRYFGANINVVNLD
jgi:hypothetical protein